MSAMSESKKMKLREQLEGKVKLLNETTWERRVPKDVLLEWISQFDEGPDIDTDEQTQVLFLLSHFLYFGQAEIRSLLKSLYRDMIRSPVLHEIRRANQDSLDASEIFVEYSKREQTFRFLALGNPSESSMHLLYYFRQENILPNNLFINPHEIFKPIINGTDVEWKLQFSDVGRYIFIDDMCGSGNQATQYLKDIVHPLKTLAPSLTGRLLRFVRNYAWAGSRSGAWGVRFSGGCIRARRVVSVLGSKLSNIPGKRSRSRSRERSGHLLEAR